MSDGLTDAFRRKCELCENIYTSVSGLDECPCTIKHKNITRIDQETNGTHGWYVRVRFYGKTYPKFFSDSKFKGRLNSLRNAIDWRNKKEIQIGKIRTDRHCVFVCSNSTGVVGVRLNENKKRYEVSWVNTSGKQGKTTVSIRKHGKRKAFKIACDIREQKETERRIAY